MRIVAAIAAILAVFSAGCDRGWRMRPARLGAPAPDFTVSDGEHTLSLAQFRGQVVVLNFWASWCPPCVEETPSLIALGRQLQSKGIVLVAISEDESEQDYRRFVSENNLESSMLVVRDTRRAVAPQFGTYVFPETYVVDRGGIVRRKFIGAVDWTKPEILESLVRLQAQAPAPSRAAR